MAHSCQYAGSKGEKQEGIKYESVTFILRMNFCYIIFLCCFILQRDDHYAGACTKCPPGQYLRDKSTCVPREDCNCVLPNGMSAPVCFYSFFK